MKSKNSHFAAAKSFNKKAAKLQTKPVKEQNFLKYYGFHACMALWKSRPDAILRVYLEQRQVKDAAALLKWCASKNKPYHVVSPEEMLKISNSVHHEGLCVVAQELTGITFAQCFEQLKKNKNPHCLLYIDEVQNPHNVGSIMRVCAHFGISYILAESKTLPKISPSTYRIAQGGAECVTLVGLGDGKAAFLQLASIGFITVATSSHTGKNLYHYSFPLRTVIVMGSESEGVKASTFKSSQETLYIPGSGLVESLNVSVATGLLLGEYYRQHQM